MNFEVRQDTVNNKTFFCLALSLFPGLGTGYIEPLIEQCGSVSGVFSLPRSELTRFRLSSETIRFVPSGFAQKSTEETLESARSVFRVRQGNHQDAGLGAGLAGSHHREWS